MKFIVLGLLGMIVTGGALHTWGWVLDWWWRRKKK